MKLLFDQNISYRISNSLSAIFSKSRHVSDVGLLNSTDIEIYRYAFQHDMAIVTFDSDFFELSLVKNSGPKVIWITTGNLRTAEVSKLLNDNILLIRHFIEDVSQADSLCLKLG